MSYVGGLSTQDQMLIEQRVTNEAKSAGVAYLLWFFTGSLGGHRFYLGHPGTGAAMLVLFILGWLTLILVVGVALLIAVGLWALIDAFLIPGMIASQKDEVRNRLTMTALAQQRSNLGPPTNARPDLIAVR